MSDPQSVLPESVSGYGQPKPAANPAVARRRTLILVAGALAAVVLIGLALLSTIRPAPPAPMVLGAGGFTPTASPPTPTATAAPTIAVGFTPGARDQVIPAGAAVTHLGPVELVNGETECFVEFQRARIWGNCAALGFPDAPAPTPVPAPPARPAAPPAPAWNPAPPAPAPAPEPAPEPAPVPAPVGDQAKPCTHPRCMP